MAKQSLRGMWLSQFDMQMLYRDNNKQRDVEDYTDKVRVILEKLRSDGFNTVILQLRPNGDSMYESNYFPLSKYVAGEFAGEIGYDPVEILISEAKKRKIAVHGWINPLRLMTTAELANAPDDYAVKNWYDQNNGNVVLVEDRLYLNPAKPQARALIVAGAVEICKRYAVSGVHMDDYFYPTEQAYFDESDFKSSSFGSLDEFRADNITKLISELYSAIKSVDKNLVFGVSPAGNIWSLYKGYGVDINAWCENGIVDYLMPQLYFGFENATCPFEETLAAWENAVENSNVALYIGLTAGKAVLSNSGGIDVFAGSEEGKTEWIKNKNILSRSISAISNSLATGYCFFSLQYFYDPKTGTNNPLFSEEYANLAPIMREKY